MGPLLVGPERFMEEARASGFTEEQAVFMWRHMASMVAECQADLAVRYLGKALPEFGRFGRVVERVGPSPAGEVAR